MQFVLRAAVVATLIGCVPGPRAPVDLRGADVTRIQFGLRHARSAICPGEPVELDVTIDARVDGAPITVTQRRREIDEAIFDVDQLYLESPQGRFEDGAFLPAADARTSLGPGFVFYARAPRGPAFAIRFPPYYECGGRIGGEGISGRPGVDESEPNGHNPGRVGLSEVVAGPAVTRSIEGGEGGHGPAITVFVTWVETADYTKLLAARSVGDVDMLTLVAPGYSLNVAAVGGRGGDGGRGVHGQPLGGVGGNGGRGGTGGEGGVVDVILDERFPELAGQVNVDVAGGAGGHSGVAGGGGDPEILVPSRKKLRSDYVMVGTKGAPGLAGAIGPRGAPGRFEIRSGDVRARFDGTAGLRVL